MQYNDTCINLNNETRYENLGAEKECRICPELTFTPSPRYFGTPPAHPLRLVLVDPTDKYLKIVETSSPMLIRTTACLPSSFLLLPPTLSV